MRQAVPLEKQVAARVRVLYRAVGCEVYSTQQTRPSRQAIGLPDFYVVHARLGGFWHEVKREGGRQSDGQRAFQFTVEAAGVGYVLGGTEEARVYLQQRGLLAKTLTEQAREIREDIRRGYAR